MRGTHAVVPLYLEEYHLQPRSKIIIKMILLSSKNHYSEVTPKIWVHIIVHHTHTTHPMSSPKRKWKTPNGSCQMGWPHATTPWMPCISCQATYLTKYRALFNLIIKPLFQFTTDTMLGWFHYATLNVHRPCSSAETRAYGFNSVRNIL